MPPIGRTFATWQVHALDYLNEVLALGAVREPRIGFDRRRHLYGRALVRVELAQLPFVEQVAHKERARQHVNRPAVIDEEIGRKYPLDNHARLVARVASRSQNSEARDHRVACGLLGQLVDVVLIEFRVAKIRELSRALLLKPIATNRDEHRARPCLCDLRDHRIDRQGKHVAGDLRL